MERIATLEVWIDTESTYGFGSRLEIKNAPAYRIVLQPNFDGQVDNLEKRFPWHSFAHELGHFLQQVSKQPRLPSPYKKTAIEVQAWANAHKLGAPCDSKLKQAALLQYLENEVRAKLGPLGQLF